MFDAESLALTKGHRMKEARKLFGFALRHDAETTYDLLDRPATGDLPLTASRRTGAEYAEEFGAESDAQDLFLYGVADTMRLILPILKMHRALPKEVALQIAQHPDTVASHALAANQAQERSNELVYAQPGRAFDLSPKRDSIWMISDDVTLREGRGCEAVTYSGGELTVEPIFRRFTVWAGELAVHSYFDHLDDNAPEPSLF